MLWCQHMEVGDRQDTRPDPFHHLVFAVEHGFYAHLFLELYGEGYFNRLQKGRGSAIFAGLDFINVFMPAPGVGPIHGAPSRVIGHLVFVQFWVKNQDSCRTRASQELMGGKIDGIEVLSGLLGVHTNIYVRGRAGEIHEAEPAVAVHDFRDLVVGRKNPRHIGAGSDRCDFGFPPLVAGQEQLQVLQVYEPIFCGGDDLEVHDGFQPARLVGVVFHVGHEHDRAVFFREVYPVAVPLVDFQSEDALELIDYAGHARVRGDQYVLLFSAHVCLDDRLRMVVRLGHRISGDGRFGMRIAHERADFPGNQRLDGHIEPTAGRPVGIDDFFDPIRSLEGLPNSDRVLSERGEMRFEGSLLGVDGEVPHRAARFFNWFLIFPANSAASSLLGASA